MKSEEMINEHLQKGWELARWDSHGFILKKTRRNIPAGAGWAVLTFGFSLMDRASYTDEWTIRAKTDEKGNVTSWERSVDYA